ncbi:hypothetical protein PIB30_094450 [Stylosanthes scabra]|uniref:Uncharacterized protein n=1 Tax=Stylosanthes scabra TaxID=79078 RepID=A0ABU6YUZ8_9FABA|nr:hypothetical protein [Stylosanthes scabra]
MSFSSGAVAVAVAVIVASCSSGSNGVLLFLCRSLLQNRSVFAPSTIAAAPPFSAPSLRRVCSSSVIASTTSVGIVQQKIVNLRGKLISYLRCTNWQAVPDENRNKMLAYAKQKCNAQKDGEPWVSATIGEAWKQFKKRIKEFHYTPYQSFREMLKNRPTTISEDHFQKLVRFWNYDVTSAIAKKNTENRSKQKCNHRMRPVNFELIRAELHAKKDNNEDHSQAEMFVATRTNKKGEPLHSSTQEMIVSYLK